MNIRIKQGVALRLLSALVLCVGAGVWAGEMPPPLPSAAEMLPEGTVLYVQIAPWSKWSSDFSHTSLSQIFTEPEVRTFLAGPFERLTQVLNQTLVPAPQAGTAPTPATPAPETHRLQSVVSAINEWAPGPCTVAAKFSAADAQAKRPVAVAVVLGLGHEPDVSFVTSLADLALRGKATWLSVTDYDQTRIFAVQLISNGVARAYALAVDKGQLVVSNDPDFAKQILDGLEGKQQKKLSDAAAYKASGLSGTEQLTAYLDVAGLQAALDGSAARTAEQQQQRNDFFALAGLNKSSALFLGLRMNGSAFESRTAVFSTGARTGLLSLLHETPLSAEALKVCPQNAVFATGLRVRPEQLRPFIRNIAGAIHGSKGQANWDEFEKQLNTELGADLNTEFQSAFGNELVVVCLAGEKDSGPYGPLSAVVGSLPVQDATKAEKIVKQLLTHAATRLDPKGNAANVLKSVDFEGLKIQYLTPPPMGAVIQLAPAFVLLPNRLLAAPDVLTLKRAISIVQNGPYLADSEAFKSAIGQAGGETGSMFEYLDWAQVYRGSFSRLTETLRWLEPMGVLSQVGVDLNLLPSTDSVAKHLFPAVTVAHVLPDGVVFLGRSPLPSLSVLTPPAMAISAVINSIQPQQGAVEVKK